MAKKKQPGKDARANKEKPEATEDLSEMMSMDEDWEILELTERTIVRQAPEDEETISLSPPDMDGSDDNEEYVFVTDDSAEVSDADDDDDDDVMDLSKPEDGEDDPETDESSQDEEEEETVDETPDINDIADFGELEEETPPAPKADKKKPAQGKTVKGKTGGGKAPRNKTVLGIIALLSLVLVSLVVVIVVLLQRRPGEPLDTASVKTGQPVAKTISTSEPTTPPRPVSAAKPKPVEKPGPQSAKAIPTPKPRPVTMPQPAAPTRPAEIPESTGSGTARQIQPAVPSAMERAPAPQQPVATPPVAVEEDIRVTAQSSQDMVHTLYNIDFQETGGALQMRISANGPVGEYKSFPLSNPSRLVIDLFGKWNKPPFLDKMVTTGYISRIRLGQHDDKLRIVADLRTDQPLSPVFTPTRDGLSINLSTK